jgi:uroporphyrinogen decarboxylase
MDWEKLALLTPSAPHLARQLACLRSIRAGLGPETPMLQTIFNPLAQAKNLAGGDTLLAHLRRYPEAVMQGLEIITETTRRFILAALETGVDGIFYAVQHAQGHLLAPDEFALFAQPHDLRLLEAANSLWCNMVHLHGGNILFEQVSRYPAHILNWHDRETDWSLSAGQKLFRGAVCGGLSQDTLVLGTQAQVQEEAAEALTQTGGKRFILGTGCVVPVIAPHGNIITARKAVEILSSTRRGAEGEG